MVVLSDFLLGYVMSIGKMGKMRVGIAVPNKEFGLRGEEGIQAAQ
jgi:hypothetical protein